MSGFSPYWPALVMLLALSIDLVAGWPPALFSAIGHPVTWMGRWIAFADQAWNRGGTGWRFIAGMLTSLILIAGTGVIALALQVLLMDVPGGVVALAVLAWPLLAAKSMFDHVAAVHKPLATGDIDGARHAVSMIVGRDVSALDEAGISRASLESLAENTGDGIVAPLFWGLVAGLPGIAAYKAINTLDSMIGYRNDKYEYFGKFAARLDDVVNWVPARLTGLLFALAACSGRALVIIWLDARHHRSPNAGWPEAAFAAALDVRLSGPRQYGDTLTQDPWINGTGQDADASVIQAGLRVFRRLIILLLALVAGLAAFGGMI